MMSAEELGGSAHSTGMYVGRGETVLLHDTLLDRFADSLDLAGKSLTDDEIKARIEGQLGKLLGRDVKFSHDKPASGDESRIKTTVFDNSDPYRNHPNDVWPLHAPPAHLH